MTKKKIYNFLENPKTLTEKCIQTIIFVLIIISFFLTLFEFFQEEFVAKYKLLFSVSEYIILVIFTTEYILRFFIATKKIKFLKKPLNIIDFLAIFPTYLEFILPFFMNTTSVRFIRILRLLRLSRILKLLRHRKVFKKIFCWKNTILKAIFPIIVLFILLKSAVWILEYNSLWIKAPNLGELFAMTGFALGIILSQKIATSHDKFIRVEETVSKLYSTLHSFSIVINKGKKGEGLIYAHNWAKEFYRILTNYKANNYDINIANEKLYKAIITSKNKTDKLIEIHSDICKDASLCLNKKTHLTPRAYDTLLHQATMLYLFLISFFIPGFAGMISVVIASYILYGMYNLTQDLDSIMGGDFNLMNVDVCEFKSFVKNKKWI